MLSIGRASLGLGKTKQRPNVGNAKSDVICSTWIGSTLSCVKIDSQLGASVSIWQKGLGLLVEEGCVAPDHRKEFLSMLMWAG